MGNCFEYIYPMYIASSLHPKALELKYFAPNFELSKITSPDLAAMLKSSLVVDNVSLSNILTGSNIFWEAGESITNLLEIPGLSPVSYLIAPSDIVKIQEKPSKDRLKSLQRFRDEALYKNGHVKIDSIHFSEEYQCWIILIDSRWRNGQSYQMRSVISQTLKLDQRYIYLALAQDKDQKLPLYKDIASFLDGIYARQKILEGGYMTPALNHIYQIEKLDFLCTEKLGFSKQSPIADQVVDINTYNKDRSIKTMAHTDNAVMNDTLKHIDDDGFRPGDWAYCGYNGIGAYGDTVNLRPIWKDGKLAKVFSYGFDKVFFVSSDTPRKVVPLSYVVDHPDFLRDFNEYNEW